MDSQESQEMLYSCIANLNTISLHYENSAAEILLLHLLATWQAS